jgi:hypothetical protein
MEDLKVLSINPLIDFLGEEKAEIVTIFPDLNLGVLIARFTDFGEEDIKKLVDFLKNFPGVFVDPIWDKIETDLISVFNNRLRVSERLVLLTEPFCLSVSKDIKFVRCIKKQINGSTTFGPIPVQSISGGDSIAVLLKAS